MRMLGWVGVVALTLSGSAMAARAQEMDAHELARQVIYNELHDREHDSHCEYRSRSVTPGETVVREQVETPHGPIFRVLEREGVPLSETEQCKEDARLKKLLHSQRELDNLQHEHESDEARLARIMGLLPRAFLFSYAGKSPLAADGDTVTLNFRPDPAFVPASYEERVMRVLEGTLTVNLRFKRMLEMRGTLSQSVDFGYGLLGHVEKGGTFVIHRQQVSEEHWKTDLVDVHIEGKVLLFKNVNKQQREERSDFHSVPLDLNMETAKQMLDETARTQQPQLARSGR